MQKVKTHTLSNSKIIEILNSEEDTYSAEQAREISKSITKFSQLLYKYWNEEFKREKGNSISKS